MALGVKEMNREKCKTKANELAEMCISNPQQFAAEYKAAYESGDYTEAERDTLLPLCNVYVDVKQGRSTRADAAREQHRIFAVAELRE